MNAHQARQITDLESYKEVTGAKRFKRTKDEVARGLSPEEALAERLAQFGSETEISGNSAPEPKRTRRSSKGEIVLRIRPKRGVSLADYDIPEGEFEIEEDQQFYTWLEELHTARYGDHPRALLFQHLLDFGVGELPGELPSEAHVTAFIKHGKTMALPDPELQAEIDSYEEDNAEH